MCGALRRLDSFTSVSRQLWRADGQLLEELDRLREALRLRRTNPGDPSAAIAADAALSSFALALDIRDEHADELDRLREPDYEVS